MCLSLGKNRDVLITFFVFILTCFTYVGMLLYLPDGLLIKLLAAPFVGAISRVYEGISIVVLILASVGILRTLNFIISSLWHKTAGLIIVAWIMTPSVLVQFNLVQLAKSFDTISV